MDSSSLRSTSTHLLLAPEQLSPAGEILLDTDTDHHLRRVLRLRDGELVSATDGAGRWLIATVVLDGSSLRLHPDSDVAVDAPDPTPLNIAVAMPKGDRLDWLVQKTTELGVDRIVLLHTERSVVRWKPDRVEGQLERLQRISDEACRQSRRLWRVTIDAPVAAADVLGSCVVTEPGGRALAPTDRSIAIGPEGGWSPAELELAGDLVSLGRNILRTETAAVAVSALCVTFER